MLTPPTTKVKARADCSKSKKERAKIKKREQKVHRCYHATLRLFEFLEKLKLSGRMLDYNWE